MSADLLHAGFSESQSEYEVGVCGSRQSLGLTMTAQSRGRDGAPHGSFPFFFRSELKAEGIGETHENPKVT